MNRMVVFGNDAGTKGSGGANTTVIENVGQTAVSGTVNAGNTRRAAAPSAHTVFGDDTDFGEPAQPLSPPTIQQSPVARPVQSDRTTRKLVGWLVTYSFDAMGVDYKIYEGRNVIGRDIDCNITVNDSMMSGKHAVLMFRADKYSLTDSQSTHGTFVNDEDIDNNHKTFLKDGDEIRMGRTKFMIRFSLPSKGEQTYVQQPNSVPETPPTPTPPLPEWKRCANNHHYQGDTCPHCAGKTTTGEDKETKVY